MGKIFSVNNIKDIEDKLSHWNSEQVRSTKGIGILIKSF